MSLHYIAQSINRELASQSKMKVGAVINHPDGRTVKIIDGCFLDAIYGRVSNWWSWKEVKKDGTLGKKEEGYGW